MIERDRNNLLCDFVTSDESWVFLYQSETKE